MPFYRVIWEKNKIYSSYIVHMIYANYVHHEQIARRLWYDTEMCVWETGLFGRVFSKDLPSREREGMRKWTRAKSKSHRISSYWLSRVIFLSIPEVRQLTRIISRSRYSIPGTWSCNDTWCSQQKETAWQRRIAEILNGTKYTCLRNSGDSADCRTGSIDAYTEGRSARLSC